MTTAPKLSRAQERLLDRLTASAVMPGAANTTLVSGHEYRTALALERRGLVSVRYQGRSMGWARVLNLPTT